MGSAHLGFEVVEPVAALLKGIVGMSRAHRSSCGRRGDLVPALLAMALEAAQSARKGDVEIGTHGQYSVRSDQSL